MYAVTKTYGHDLGLSACFRQWRAESHCRFLHGYPLSFKLEFRADRLNENNWVIDFGGLKPIKEHLVYMFDHTLVVAASDPEMATLIRLGDIYGLAQTRVIPEVGCEAFATYVWNWVDNWLVSTEDHGRVRIRSVEVREHGANSAIYFGNN